MRAESDPTFLAPPGEVADWRMVLLFDAVAGSGALAALPATVDELTSTLLLDGHGLRVALDALAVWGVVDRGDDGRYLLGPAVPDSEVAAQLRHHARAVRRWSATLDTRLRGAPPDAHSGMPDPELFLDALAVTARKAAPRVVDLCLARFPDAERVLDLGGGHGEYSLEFARRGLRVTMQDQPQMVDIVARRGRLAAAGVELFAGSFFEVLPDGPFDLAFCAGVTHTFDGDHNLALYRRLRPVVAAGGGIAVVTFLRHRHPLADVFAVQMLANANGGDTHGEDEYRAWLTAAGFHVDDEPVDPVDRPQSLMFAT